MRTNQKTQTKRSVKAEAKTAAGFDNGKNLAFDSASSFPLTPPARIKIEGKQNGNNGRKKSRAALRPQRESTKDFIPEPAPAKQTIEDLVRRMVHDHFETEEFVERIIWFKSIAGEEEIHLLEVNSDTPPSGVVMMLYFGATEEIPLPARVADVTPEEWEKIRGREISLPKGWSLNEAVEFEREKCLAKRD